MIGVTDFVGLGALISATFAGLVSLVVAVRQTAVRAQVQEVRANTATSNGHTLGELVEKNEARHAGRP